MLALRDLSHDPKLAEALGNMVVAWAYAEETLIFSLARVADINLNMALAGLHRLPTFESRIKFIRASPSKDYYSDDDAYLGVKVRQFYQ
jgi:hypothetical protein